MIRASDSLKAYIESQMNVVELAKKMEISAASLYNILEGKNISSVIIGKLMKETGFSFDKAFIVTEKKVVKK